jgi:hypothetical protein
MRKQRFYAGSLVLVGLLAVGALSGCSLLSGAVPAQPAVSGPTGDTPVQTVGAQPVPCDHPGITLPAADPLGAPDYPYGLSFRPPFYPSAQLGADRGASMFVSVVAATPDITVFDVLGGSDGPSRDLGLIGVDIASGQTVWTMVPPDAASGFDVSSNGVDAFAVTSTHGDQDPTLAVTQIIDAQSGRVLASHTWDASHVYVDTMSADTIVVTSGSKMLGYRDIDLSTPVWQHDFDLKPDGQDNTVWGPWSSSVIGDAILTTAGYVNIADGTPAFGSDAEPSAAYWTVGEGSVVRGTSVNSTTNAPNSLQLWDPKSDRSLWPVTVDDEWLNGCGDNWCPNLLAAQDVLVADCTSDTICGYALADGTKLWQIPFSSPGGNDQVTIDGSVGRYFVLDNLPLANGSSPFDQGGINLIQLSDGQNDHVLGQGQVVTGQCVAYSWTDQSITAYDGFSADLTKLWTVPMPSVNATPAGYGYSGQLVVASGNLAVIGTDGEVWIAQPPQS